MSVNVGTISAILDLEDRMSGKLKHAGTGVEALAGKIRNALTIGAIIGAAKAFGDFAGQIDDMSKRLNIGTDAVQKLSFAAKQNGADMGTVAASMDFLARKLAEGDDSTVGGLKQLGLNFNAVRAMSMDEAFIAVGNAVAGIEDPMLRAQLRTELLGRGAGRLQSMLQNLNEEMAKAPRLTEDQVAAGDKLGDSFDSLITSGKVLIGAILSPLAPKMETAANATASFTNALNAINATASAQKYGVIAGALGVYNDLVAKSAQGALAHAEKLALATHAANVGDGALKKLTMTETDRKFAEEAMTEAVKKSTEAQKKSNEEIKQAEEAYRQMVNWIEERRLADEGAALAFQNSAKHLDVMSLSLMVNTENLKRAANAAKGLTYDGLIPMIEATDELTMGLARGGQGMSQFGVESQNVATKTVGVFSTMADSIGAVMARIPDLLVSAFTGGGGVLGALKAFGVQMAEAVLRPLIAGIAKLAVGKLGLGALTAAMSGLGGAAAGTAVAGATAATAVGGVGAAATTAGIAGTVAMGAVTLGIGAAAIGAYALIKHFTGVSKAEKEGRVAALEFRQALEQVTTQTQRLEAGNDRWKLSVISIRDAYIAAGKTEADAMKAADALWRAEKQGGDSVKKVIEEIATVMESGMKPAIENTMQSVDDGIWKTMHTFSDLRANMELPITTIHRIVNEGTPLSTKADELALVATSSDERLREMISSFLERNVGDRHRIPSALGISMTKVAALGFAEGGIVTTPTLGMIGEAGPEAVVPLDRWSSDNRDVVDAIQELRREMARRESDLPRAIKRAIMDGMVLAR